MTKTNMYKLFALFALTLLATSCAFIELQKDLDRIAAGGALHGRIIDRSNEEDSIIMIAYDEDKKIVKYKHLHQHADYYLFMLPAGQKYHLVIFEDINDNLKYDKGEPAGYWANPEKEILEAQSKIITDLVISKKTIIPSGYPADIGRLDESLGDKFIIKTGEVADLDNDKFSAAYGKKGLWTPLKFLEEDGVGVYFLEKYDPEKIPILFVYGIGGYPQSWKSFFEKVDRTKYQPWFYYYPSGVRLGNAGKALDIIVNELHIKYKFETMYVIAHSMGGLVAKEFIAKNDTAEQKDYIKLFITISTPWGGDKDAEWAKHAPAVIPCWHDMTPDSEFVKNISAKKIPSDIPYYLLFSYNGDRKPFRRNNDNIVYLSSQLHLEMQERAEKIYGFDLNHTKILQDKDVLNICNAILAKYDTRKRDVKRPEKKESSFFDFLYKN